MEDAVTSGKTENTGTADLDKHKLQELYEWATVSIYNLIYTILYFYLQL